MANAAPLLRMSVSIPADIEDPQGKDMEAYIIAHNETVRALSASPRRWPEFLQTGVRPVTHASQRITASTVTFVQI